MGSPRSGTSRSGSETRQRQRRLTYRITEQEYAQVEAAASAARLSLASYARLRTVEQPSTRTRGRPTVDLQALAKALALVNRVGGNLHQLVRHLNFGGIPYPDEVRAALRGYEEMVFAIMHAIGRAR